MQKKKDDNKFALTYTPIGKGDSFIKELAKSIPPQFKATQKTSYFFSTIFAIVVAIGIINSLMPLMNMDLSFTPETSKNDTKAFELNVNVGIPLSFFGSDTETGSKINMSPFNFVIDLILYLILAYLMDVILNFMFTLKIIPSKEELKQKPKEIQIQKKGIAEKTTEKIAEKVAEKIGTTNKIKNANQTNNITNTAPQNNTPTNQIK